MHGCQKPTGHEGPHETVTGLGVSCCGPTQDALPETSSMARDPSAIADLVVQDVAEIPYRTSPDDWPEAMIVTAEELHAFVVRRVRGADAAPEPVAAPSASDEERIAAWKNSVSSSADLSVVLSAEDLMRKFAARAAEADRLRAENADMTRVGAAMRRCGMARKGAK